MNPGRWRHIADTYAEMGMAAPNISLDGFIYDRNPQTDMTWFYFSLLGALGMIGIVSGIAARFYQLNTIIRREMVAREIVTANLLALEQKYQILVEHAPFPILISCLRDGRILYINPKAAQKLEITQEHAIGKLTHDYYADPEDRDSLLVTIERQGYLQNAEVLLKATTGATFWVNVSATLIAFADEPAIFLALVDVTKRKELEKQLETMAMTDDLTGLFNRRYFAAKGNAEFQRAHRYKTPLSMLMLDIDRFKLINDTYGHEAGDHVLKECATLMGQQLREIDILGRLGGEEFGVLLPNTDESHTLILAERLRHTIAQHPFVIHGKPVSITASIGVAALHDDITLLDGVLRHADAAMYQAKQQGRNRVVVYGAEEEPSS